VAYNLPFLCIFGSCIADYSSAVVIDWFIFPVWNSRARSGPAVAKGICLRMEPESGVRTFAVRLDFSSGQLNDNFRVGVIQVNASAPTAILPNQVRFHLNEESSGNI